MTEAEWITSTEPSRMLRWLSGTAAHENPPGRVSSPRKPRLFACACCRAVWDGTECQACHGDGTIVLFRGPGATNPYHAVCPCGTGRVGGLTDPRSRRAVEVAELEADGIADPKEIGELAHTTITGCLSEAAALPGRALEFTATLGLSPATQAALLRDIFGNPFRHVCYPTSLVRHDGTSLCRCGKEKLFPWLVWRDRLIPRTAQAAYDGRDWHDLPLLADMLLDAAHECGCDVPEEVLRHLSGEERCPQCGGSGVWASGVERPMGEKEWLRCECEQTGGWAPLRGPHVRGCWCVDLLLGKE